MRKRVKNSEEPGHSLAKVRKVYKTRDVDYANQLLRCGCILLEVTDGHFILGQIEKFVCPRCATSLDYHQVKVNLNSDNCGWDKGKVNCPQCGDLKIPLSVELDEFFVDQAANGSKGQGE